MNFKLLEFIALRLIPGIGPARRAKPENYWNRKLFPDRPPPQKKNCNFPEVSAWKLFFWFRYNLGPDSIYLSINQSIYLSISVNLSVYLSIYFALRSIVLSRSYTNFFLRCCFAPRSMWNPQEHSIIFNQFHELTLDDCQLYSGLPARKTPFPHEILTN